MKKIICLMLVLMFSFGMVSNVRQEKVEAASVAIGFAVFKAGIAFAGFATYASWFYANGYHIPINNLIAGYANQYYDYANGVYIQKTDKINLIEKMNLYTSALLSGNLDQVPSMADLNAIKDDIVKQFPAKVDVTTITPDKTFTVSTFNSYEYLEGANNIYGIKESEIGKIIRLNFTSQTDSPYHVFLKMVNTGHYVQGNSLLPTILLIQPNGVVNQLKMSNYLIVQSLDIIPGMFNVTTLTSMGGTVIDRVRDIKKRGYENPDTVDDYDIIAGTYADTTHPFVFAKPNYQSALNFKAVDMEGLLGLLNTDEYLQREVSDLLEKSKVNEENPDIAPAINPDGMIYYPGTETSNPDLPYSPTETWFNNLMGWLVGMPGKIAEKVADIPILGDLVGIGQSIVGKLTDIWDWLRSGLLGILQLILNAILDILAFLVGLPALLIQLLKDALIWLFVPDATFFNGKLEEFKLNFAFIDTFTSFIQRLEDMTSSNAVPTVSVDLSKFKGSFGGKPISMGAEAYILDMRWYLPFKALGDLMFTAFVYVMFIWRFFGRLPEIISGGGLLYTADSKTDDLVRKLEGKKK